MDRFSTAMNNHAFFNQIPALLLVVMATGKIVAVSDRWLQTLGYERSAVLGRSLLHFLSTATQTLVQTAYLPLLQNTGQLQDVVGEFVQHNGELRTLQARVTRSDEAGGESPYYLIALQENPIISEAETLLFTLAKGTASASGADFFRSLVIHLAQVFDVRFAMVAECTSRSLTRVRTLAYIDRTQFLENVEYDVAGTPCAAVMAGESCYYPAKLNEHFHVGSTIDSYLGTPLFDRQGQVIGHLAVTDDKPMLRTRRDVAILEIFAARAAAELERKQAEQALVEARERLARELHDSVTQSLYSLTLIIEGWRRLAHSGQFDNAEARLAELGAISQQTLREIRLLVYELHPLALAQDGLVSVVQQRLNAVEKRSGIEVQLLADPLLALPHGLEIELYRMIQEVLNSRLKAALADPVTLHITKNELAVALDITEHSQNFEHNYIVDQWHPTLNRLRIHAEKLGGTATLIATPDQEIMVRVCLPL